MRITPVPRAAFTPGHLRSGRRETTQDSCLAVKLNQKVSLHVLGCRYVPAERFDAASSLTDSYPLVSDTLCFGDSYGEHWGTIAFSEWFKLKKLVAKVLIHRQQRKLCIRMDLLVALL